MPLSKSAKPHFAIGHCHAPKGLLRQGPVGLPGQVGLERLARSGKVPRKLGETPPPQESGHELLHHWQRRVLLVHAQLGPEEGHGFHRAGQL